MSAPVAFAGLRGALMVCGTTSDAGKSIVVTALCRLLARAGVTVAPFKGQNMALNSAVTVDGAEIGRAQALQAEAAGVAAEAAMNPVLLKPTGERTSQVIVRGHPIGVMTAAEYHAYKPELFPVVLDALAGLRARFDVVVCEGAGSPAEINLAAHDLVNLRVAESAGINALIVGDIDRGGVFASLYGSVMLLGAGQRRAVRGFVINKLRGDPALLGDGPAQLEARCGVPTLGVLPHLGELGLDAEDSLALDAWQPRAGAALDVAVVRLPRISNFTDLDALRAERHVSIRLVRTPAELGRPDLVILPGTKATVDDLAWLRASGFVDPLAELAGRAAAGGRPAPAILGICGGYQMLGERLVDGVESAEAEVDGLGLLAVRTEFEAAKVLARRHGCALGARVHGYQIHHGRVRAQGGEPWLVLDPDEPEGIREGAVWGTTLHGLFDDDGFRAAFLARYGVASTVAFGAERERRLDLLADAVAAHLDLSRIAELIAEAA